MLDRHRKDVKLVLQEDKVLSLPSPSLLHGEGDFKPAAQQTAKSNLETFTEQINTTSIKLFPNFDPRIEDGKALNAVVHSAEMTYCADSYTAQHEVIDVGSFELGSATTQARVQLVYGVLVFHIRPDSKIYKIEFIYMNEANNSPFASICRVMLAAARIGGK